MSIGFWCIFISVLLIYIAKLPLANSMAKEGSGRYDNHNPRAQQSRLNGFGARALAAHLNSFEVFPIFAAGVLMAFVTHTQGPWVDGLAVTFVISRMGYLLCYWFDLAWQRSLLWLVGVVCCLLLMLSPVIG